MSWYGDALGKAAFYARDNALVSPWAQGQLVRGEVSPDRSRGSPTSGPQSGETGGTGSGWHDRRAAPAAAPVNGGAWKGNPGAVPLGGAKKPGAEHGARGGMPSPLPPTTPGTESGPGILENWFNQRANGTDPGWQYAMNRGMDSIDSRMAAGGSYNSGARGQQLGDFATNMGAQREGQLDALAGGASGEHRGRVNDMWNQGMGLANGQSGLMSVYDVNGANALNAANQAILSMYLNQQGVKNQSNQQGFNNLITAAAVA